MEFVVNTLVSGIAVAISSYILSGVKVRSILTAFWVAFLLAIVNATIGAVLKFVAFPITFITLGLFSFVINVLMIMLVDKIVPGFEIKNFWWAVLFAILLAIITTVFNWFI